MKNLSISYDFSGSPTKKVPKRKATTEQDLDEMKAKIEDERKKLKDVKNMAEEEKNKIKYELKRQEDELAKAQLEHDAMKAGLNIFKYSRIFINEYSLKGE